MSKNSNNNQASQSGGFVPVSYGSGRRRSHPSLSSENAPVASGLSQYSRYSSNYQNRRPQGGQGKSKTVLIVVIVLALAAAVALGVFAFKEIQKGQVNADLHSMSQEEMTAVDNELTRTTTFTEPFTVLLLGSDARSDDPDMGARTDTIVLVRIDPTQNIISMVSIPRDTMVQIPGYGTNKFNATYTYGGPSGTISAVKELCGVDINHYAEINFEGLVGLIDAIGGIDVMVDEEINDPDAGDIVIPAGMQHLDGAATLVFSRSRAYVDGDYTRVSNQRKVIEAIVNRGLTAPATELHGLIQQSADFLTTDSAMDVDFIYSLADQIRHNNDYPIVIYSSTLPSSIADIEGVSYVIADPYGVEDMMERMMAGQPLEDETVEAEAAEGAAEGEAVAADAGTGYTDTSYDTGYGYTTDYGTGYDYTGGYDTGYYDTGYSYDTGYYDTGSGYNTGYGYTDGSY